MIDNESLQNLERLHKLKEDGVITAEDFDAAKQRLLTQPAKAVRRQAPAEPLSRPADDDHIGWALLPLRRYAEFTGRSSRKEFWMFQLLYVAAVVVCGVLGAVIGVTPASALLFLAFLGALVPLLAVEVRRFNDQGRSGWFVLFNLLPYIGPLIVYALMLVPGVEGDNEHGPDPRL